MQSLRCPSSWPVSMLLRNSEFLAKGIFCFHLSFTVAVVSENRVPEEALMWQDAISIKVPTGMVFAYSQSCSRVCCRLLLGPAQLRAEVAIETSLKSLLCCEVWI